MDKGVETVYELTDKTKGEVEKTMFMFINSCNWIIKYNIEV
jgi:hypothetical protein